MSLPPINRTHSVRNWVYLDGINDIVRQLTPVLEMARADHAANSGDGSAFSPAVSTKDGRPVLIWHHARTHNSHQGILFIPPEAATPKDTGDEAPGSGKNTARLVEATSRANAMELMLQRAVELREDTAKGPYNHSKVKEAVITESGVIPNRIGKRHGFTVIGVNNTLGFRSPTFQELIDMYRAHGLQRDGEDTDRVLSTNLRDRLLQHFDSGACRPAEGCGL